MNSGLINFESFDTPAGKSLIDFESFDKPEKVGQIDFEGSGEIVLPEIPKKAKKPSLIAKPAFQTAKGMLYGEGLPEGLGYLQKPAEKVVDYLGQFFMTPEEEQFLMAKHPNLMAARYAAASVLLPGISEKFASPTEMKKFLKKSPEEQRFEITGLAAGYAAFGTITKGVVPVLAKYAIKKFPWLIKPMGKAIKDSTLFRRATIRERGMIVQSTDDMVKAGLSEAQILKSLKKGNLKEFKKFKSKAIQKRMKTEVPIEPIQPKVTKSIITEPLKPTVKPTTELGRKLQVAIKAEKRPPVIADLAKRELEIKKGKIDFEAPIKKDLIIEATRQRQLAIERVEIDFEVKSVKPLSPKPPKAKPPVAPREEIKGEAIPEVKPKVEREKVEVMPEKIIPEIKIKELSSAQVIKKVGSSKPKDILMYYQNKYPELKGIKIGLLKSTKKSGLLSDEGVSKIIIGKDKKLISKESEIFLTEDALPITVRHEIEHFLDVIHSKDPKSIQPQTMGRYTHEKFPEEYLAKKVSLNAQQKSDNIEFFSGLPLHKFLKAAKGLAKLYDDYAGLPIWNYVSETLPIKAGKRFELIDRINKGIILDYRKDPKFVEVRDDTLFKIQQAKEKIKELSEAIAKFSRAEQIRIAQIIKGGVTATPKRYETAFEAIRQFQAVEKDLIELGLLGEDNRFRQLTRKEIATKFKEIKVIDNRIKVLQKKLKPIIKTSKIIRQVSDDISEEIISTTTDTTTGLYETKVTKFSELVEGRVKEALLQRGFAEGEATQMIARLKESVIPLEGKKGTLKEIKTTVKSVVTKTIIQEIEKLKTYSPSMMARARGSLVKDINKEIKKRGEILERIRLHYKMSGKLYLRKAYEKFESEKGFLSKLMGYVSKRPRLIKGYDIRRKDLSYLYRKELKEIQQAPRLVYKGLSEETHDVFMMEMFNKVAENKDWTISPQQLAVINSGKNEKLILKYKEFKPLPVTPKLGKLSGQLVDPYIWDDLNQAVIVTNDMIKAWDSVLRLWKTGKVVYNPATQCRNMLSNTILADFGGLPPHRIDIYAQAAKELLTKGQYWKEAKQTPLLGTEWAGAEIKQFLTETSELKEGNLLSKLSKTTRSLLDKPGQMYQGTEQFFKLAVFINERKAGRTIKEAAAHAEKIIFNYTKIPPAIRWAKRWYSPFITFSYKALPRFAETVIRKPWKIAKYGIMMLAVEEITRRMYGESKEEVEQEKKVLPDYMRKTVLPGQLSHLRIPYKDKYGRSKYLDLSFILPWGDIAEQWGQSHLVGRPFLPSHPLWIAVAEVAFNEILFTGQELTIKDIDSSSDYLKKIGIQLWRQAVPSLAGSYSYNKLMAAYKGEVDWALRDRSFPEAIFDVFFGLKVRSIDYTESRGRKLNYLKGRINKIKAQFEKDYAKIIYNPTPDLEHDQQRTARLYIKMNKQIDKILEKITEIEE